MLLGISAMIASALSVGGELTRRRLIGGFEPAKRQPPSTANWPPSSSVTP
jgi:hypothetical protein